MSNTGLPHVRHRVSFPVDDVEPGSKRLPEITVQTALERTARSRVVTCSEAERKLAKGGDFHPLIAAAALAYKQHLPLVAHSFCEWLQQMLETESL